MPYINRPLNSAKEWPEAQVKQWAERLGYIPDKVAKATLENTTQAVILDTDNPSHATMRRRMKKRFPFMNCKYVNDILYADIAHTVRDAGMSHEGQSLALVTCLRDRKVIKDYPMNRKQTPMT